MIWAFWALMHTLLYGSVNQINRYLQLKGTLLVRWRGLIPALMALPFLFFFPAPTDPVYYLACLISGGMVYFHDGTMYDVSARYGAQVAFRLRPLIIPCVFGLWLVLKPAQWEVMRTHPFEAAGLVACLFLIMLFLMRMAKCHISRAAFLDMLPVIFTGIVFDITNKTAMDHAQFPSSTIYYVFIVSGFSFLGSLVLAGRKAPSIIHEMGKIAPKAVPVTSIVIFSMIARNLAMMHTPNPAYVSAIGLTAPFWIMIWMKLRGEKEEADWVSGTGLVLSVIAMALVIARVH